MKKHVFVCLSFLLVLFAVSAFADYADGYTYTVKKKTAVITDYDGSETAVVIPAQLNGAAVTAIADNAFLDHADLVSVSIPDTITSIGKSAFMGCTSLVSVTFPDGVKTIGAKAFSNCSSLQRRS